MTPDLATTNTLLGIMAAVSVLEALALIGLTVGAWLLYRRAMRTLAGIETRTSAVLDDIRRVTSLA
ncbi:MAG: hypothetical protein HY824_13180, partial [Acidobacteria bacterium]|nr:hypothetical protein [Acidobacteriota bacterium]